MENNENKVVEPTQTETPKPVVIPEAETPKGNKKKPNIILIILALILLGGAGYYEYVHYIVPIMNSKESQAVNTGTPKKDENKTTNDVNKNTEDKNTTSSIDDTKVSNKIIGFAIVEGINYRSADSALVELDSEGNNRIIAKYSYTDEYGNRQYISDDYVHGEGLVYSNNKIYFTVTKIVDKTSAKKTKMVYDLTTKEVKETTDKPIDNHDYFNYIAFSSSYDTEKYPIYLNQNKISMTDKCLNFGGGACMKHESKITYGNKTVCESNDAYACVILYSTDNSYIYYNLAGEASTKTFKYDITTGETTDITYHSSTNSSAGINYTEYDNYYKNLSHVYSYKTVYYVK